MVIKYHCRIEKKIKDHKIVKVTDEMPPYTEVLECLSCGVLGVAILDKETAYESDIQL